MARAGPRSLSLHVTDHGAGLPPHAHAALAGGPAGGDGMGLGIVAELVRTLQGRVRVCHPGPGTRISVRIPLYQEGKPA